MQFDIAAMARRKLNGRKPRQPRVILRPIEPTATMAGDLYRVAYQPIIDAWRRGAALIGSRYEAALPVTDRMHDAIFDLDSILAAIEGQLSQLVIEITPRLRTWALRAEQWHRGKWRSAVLVGTGIDPQTMLGTSDVSDTVQAFVSRNVQLIRAVSDETRSRVSDIVLRSYAARIPLRQVAKEMDEAVDLGRKRALRIASDQNSKLSAGLDAARQAQAGITEFAWHHSFKKHPRRWHQARDQHVYEAATGDEVGGSDHIQPGDYPGEPPFCGCRRRAVIDLT